MTNSTTINDRILKVLSRKTKEWDNKPIPPKTKSRVSPIPREKHAFAGLFTLTTEKYSSSNGFLQQTEIVPPSITNVLIVESRIGNTDGTGYAINIKKIEEGSPWKISAESLEQSLQRMYNEARLESYESFFTHLSQANTFNEGRHLESLVVTSPSGKKRKITRDSLEKCTLFFSMEKRDPIVYLRETNQPVLPGSSVQNLLSEIDQSLIGDNEVGKNGFGTLAEITAINEVERYANSEGTLVRDCFSGYRANLRIFFMDPKTGKSDIRWAKSITSPDIRKQRDILLRGAEQLNKDYNLFFNNPNAISVDTGNWETYLEPDVASTHLHEAIIHSCSSDRLTEHFSCLNNDDPSENSFTIENINTPVANKNLTITCNPRKKINGGRSWGGYTIDHEGIKPGRIPIINQGKLVGLIADRNDSYILNNILGGNQIKPGSYRFGVSEESEIGEPSPRTSVLEATWQKDLSHAQLWRKFLNRIKSHGREVEYEGERKNAGLWLKGTAHGEYTSEGLSKVLAAYGHLVFADGTYVPICELVNTSNSPRAILGSMHGMGSKKARTDGFCGLDDFYVRESIFCGPCIISDLETRRVYKLPRRTD